MNFKKEKPSEDGFYWCKPVFGSVFFLDCDDSIEPSKISIAEVVTLTRTSIGSCQYVRFIGHKLPHSINSPVIKNTLWGRRVG
jgi:hypothetical protein